MSSEASYTKEITSTKEQSREYFQDVGLYTKKGTLEKEYKSSCTVKKTT